MNDPDSIARLEDDGGSTGERPRPELSPEELSELLAEVRALKEMNALKEQLRHVDRVIEELRHQQEAEPITGGLLRYPCDCGGKCGCS